MLSCVCVWCCMFSCCWLKLVLIYCCRWVVNRVIGNRGVIIGNCRFSCGWSYVLVMLCRLC